MKSSRLNPPLNYLTIDSGIYRCSFPTELNFEFLKSLQLKTVVSLSPANDSLVSFSSSHGISLIELNESEVNKNQYDIGDISFEKLNDSTIIEALKLILNRENHPVLITYRSSQILCNLIIGCLRKIQNWSMLSIFEEFRRTIYGNARLQYCYEQYLEGFDIDFLELEVQNKNK